ncbi:uncharacterized protein EI90DRAFT_3152798, partial [Cantharellus anzutake]|uniref:uncharacterized protein n=1 Tax=Cantharellus anzutake TaxID=1750568 RepID=UPI0019089EA7
MKTFQTRLRLGLDRKTGEGRRSRSLTPTRFMRACPGEEGRKTAVHDLESSRLPSSQSHREDRTPSRLALRRPKSRTNGVSHSPIDNYQRKHSDSLLMGVQATYSRVDINDSNEHPQPGEGRGLNSVEPLFIAQISDPNRCVLYGDPKSTEDGAAEYVPVRRKIGSNEIPCPTDPVRSRSGWKFNRYGDTASYPFTYNEAVRQGDRNTLKLHQKINRSQPTFHDFDKEPGSVLDIGCGDGSWIESTAKVWKTTRFFGIDLVNIQPKEMDGVDVEWRHANVLDGLPFYEDGQFDYVRMSNFFHCVPCNEVRYVHRNQSIG